MPLSDCQVRDPRIRRTRKLLQGALASLMHNKSFEEISVQDITDIATVNRATFYDHYADKYALLEAMVASGFHEFLADRHAVYHPGCASSLEQIVIAACDYLAQVHAGGQCDRQSSFAPLMDAAITHAIERLLLQGLLPEERFGSDGDKARQEPAPASAELIAATAGAAISAAVKHWLSLSQRPPAKLFATRVLELVLPMLPAGAPAAVQAAPSAP